MKRGAAAALLALACLSAAQARAAQTRTWLAGASELERGDADGVAVTSTGRLFLAPRLSRLVKPAGAGGFAHVWAEATDGSGNLFLGTGPDGAILKITPAGKQTTFFTVAEPMVTALAFLPGGDLLAGTAPEGKIYKIRPDGKGSVWSKTGERYVWSLVVARGGTVFAGTGEEGIVLRISAQGEAQKFFDSDESHVVALRALPDGWLLAGGGGRGLVYRIDPEGHGLVVYDDDLAEVKGLAVEPDGSIVAAVLASPEPERRPPAVRIQVTGGGGPAADAAGDIQDRSGVAMEGIIEGLPAYTETGTRGLRGHVVRLHPDGTSTELWRSSSEAPLCLALDQDGRPLFGVGEPARLYRVERDGAVSLLATLREAQVTGLVTSGKDVAVATSNPASAYVLETAAPETGTYLSRPIDAGGPARWGTIGWRAEGAQGHVEVYTRTGNSEDPDGTWSAWSPALTNADGNAIVNPEGRYLQWRARLLGGSSPSVAGTSVTFLARNRAPEIRELRLESPTPSVSTKAPLRWTASDPDGDPVAVEIQYRPVGGSEWKTAVRSEPAAASDADRDSGSWKEGKATWDTAAVPEGSYEVQAQAEDVGANYPGDGRKDTIPLADLVEVDRTPPKIEVRRGSGAEVTVTDAVSPVIRLEVLEAGKVKFAVKPKDGVCDSRRETFALSANDLGAPGTRLLRATDAAGNTAETPIPTP
jgi:sugar lactone lactonase YvrE